MSSPTRGEQTRAKYLRKAYRTKGREERLEPGAIEEWLRLTESDAPQDRCAAAQELCPCHVQHNDPRIWNRLLALARDPEVTVRATVLHTLGDGSPREREAEVVQTLEQMYQDPDPKLRRRIRHVLAHYRKTGKVNIL